LKNKTDIIENDNNQLKNRIIIIEKYDEKLKNITNEIEKDNIELGNKITIIENDNEELNNRITIIEYENNELNNRTTNIETNNYELKNSIYSFETSNKDLELKIERLRNEHDNLYDRFEAMEEMKTEMNKYYNNLFTQSNIIKLEERKLISLWILPYHNLKFNLLYRASTDGYDTNIFHSKCDNKGPTVFVARLSNNNRIGGFASSSWKSNVGDIKDEKAFLFSLSNKIKYGLKNKYITNSLYGQENSSVLFGPNSGLDYKQDDFVITGKTAHCREEGAKYNFIMSDICGIKHIEVEEFEVYSVHNYAN
jgi:hypothetical protein